MSTNKLINSLITDNKDEAKNAFLSSIKEKVSTAFEVKKVELASDILGQIEESVNEESVNEVKGMKPTDNTHVIYSQSEGGYWRHNQNDWVFNKKHATRFNPKNYGRLPMTSGNDAILVPHNLKESTEELYDDDPTKGIASHELVLYADNHSGLYRQSHTPIMANLKKKVAKGTYDHEKAKVLWGYHADRAAIAYHKEFGDKSQPWHKMFSKGDRKKAAAEFADNAKDELHEGVNEDAVSLTKSQRYKTSKQ